MWSVYEFGPTVGRLASDLHLPLRYDVDRFIRRYPSLRRVGAGRQRDGFANSNVDCARSVSAC